MSASAFVDALGRWAPPAHVFNPWRDRSADDAGPDAVALRRARLLRHLAVDRPRALLLGEAPGYQGARISGCAFTSERLLLQGAIPRQLREDGPLSTRTPPWSEPSATIVWSTLYELRIAESVVIWNAFPCHPHRPDDPLSNRAPTDADHAAARDLTKAFLELYRGVPVLAIGKTAEGVLASQGIAVAACVRHPANGGATLFREGLREFVARR